MKIGHLAFVLSLLLFACKKDSPEDTIDFGPDGGYQTRNSQNYPGNGPNDATDWIADGPWNAREKELFTRLNLSLDGVLPTTIIWNAGAYPNPSAAAGTFNLTIRADPTTPAPADAWVSIVIVDKKYKELRRIDAALTSYTAFSIPNALTAFNPTIPTLAAGALYRIYYVCYVPGQQVLFRSHGDMKVE